MELWYKVKLILVTFTLVMSAYSGMHPIYTPILFFYLFFPVWGRYLIDHIGSKWYVLSVFFTEIIHGQRISVYGDWNEIPDRERVLIISNHPSEGDWFWFWSLAWRKKCIHGVKIILKDSLRLLPGPGWSMDFLSYLFLSRKWNVDRERIKHQINKLLTELTPTDPLWLVIYPEGTDYTPEKHERSKTFAQSKGLELFQYHLNPRTTGFCYVLSLMQDNITSLYDVTVGYEPKEGSNTPGKPTFATTLCGYYPKQVHIHIKRIDINSIPRDEAGQTQWLLDAFKRKDELVDDFYKSGGKGFKGPRMELAPLPWTVYFWTLMWHLGILISFYFWFTSWKYFLYCLVTTVFYTLCSFHPIFRRFFKYDPPYIPTSDPQSTSIDDKKKEA